MTAGVVGIKRLLIRGEAIPPLMFDATPRRLASRNSLDNVMFPMLLGRLDDIYCELYRANLLAELTHIGTAISNCAHNIPDGEEEPK